MQRTPLLRHGSLLLLLLAACASSPDDDDEAPDLGKGAVEASKAVGRGMKDGAQAFGRGMGQAYQGVRHGFQAPEDQARYGSYPESYVDLVKKHFFRVMRYPESTRFSFGQPSRGYMNKGLFRGGGVAWQGWLVDVQVETVQKLTRHRAGRTYVVRVREGEIIEVHENDTLLQRVAETPARVAK